MAKQKIETVRELIYYSYANLAMAHTAIDKKQEKYGTFNFMIRAKLFKGLKDGTMNMRTIFDHAFMWNQKYTPHYAKNWNRQHTLDIAVRTSLV